MVARSETDISSAGGAAAEVPDDLRRALRDKDEDVRFSAGIALERLRRPAANGE